MADIGCQVEGWDDNMIAMVQKTISLEQRMLSHLVFFLKIINYHKMSRKIDILVQVMERIT